MPSPTSRGRSVRRATVLAVVGIAVCAAALLAVTLGSTRRPAGSAIGGRAFAVRTTPATGGLLSWQAQALAAATPTRPNVVTGVPHTGARGVSETTAEIMARQAFAPPAAPPVARPEHEGPDRRLLPQNPASPDAPRWANGRPVYTPAPPRTDSPQTLGTAFTGATLAETNSFPPDTMGAVGPTQFVVFLNGRLRTFNKATGVADGVINASPDVFFQPVMTPPTATNFTSDPRIRYDRLTARWIMTIIDVPGGTGALNNRCLIAVSDAASAGVISAGTVWTFYFFQASGGRFLDYDTLGVDKNALYIGGNMFTLAGNFDNTDGYVVRKTSILSGGPIVTTTFANLLDAGFNGPYTPMGVDNVDPAATQGYFIGADAAFFGELTLRRVSDPGGSPTISGNLDVTVSSTAYPVSVPHLGNTGGNLDALDDRLFAAVLRNGRLWTAHNIGMDASGNSSNSPSRDGIRWYELQNLSTTPALAQAGSIFDSAAVDPKWYWIPTVMVSGQGHAAFGFSRAGNANRADAATVGRLSGDAAGTTGTIVPYTASTFAYNPPGDTGNPRRWGDYSYVSLDPKDDMTMWTIQQFTDATNSYGVRAVQLVAPPPVTPATATPSSVPPGGSSINVTITGPVVSGSGFYDPGPNLPVPALAFNHIAGAISGGVTVNSATYNSPTSVTLNISTVGAPVGAKNVTITNPDGQQATGNGILNVSTATAVRQATVSATHTRAGVLVRWRTWTEVSVAGFDVYRGRVRLNRRPVAAAGTVAGHAYRWLDRGARGRATYRVEAVLANGSRVGIGATRR
jgi:hypothetical protein